MKPSPIREVSGNLLAADVDALVNAVNTVGVMGKGIALQFKRAYPDMFAAYAKAAKRGELKPGRMWVWQTGRGSPISAAAPARSPDCSAMPATRSTASTSPPR